MYLLPVKLSHVAIFPPPILRLFIAPIPYISYNGITRLPSGIHTKGEVSWITILILDEVGSIEKLGFTKDQVRFINVLIENALKQYHKQLFTESL